MFAEYYPSIEFGLQAVTQLPWGHTQLLLFKVKNTDNPSIGTLLCKSRDKLITEYALKRIEKPIGVSEYQLTRVLPNELKINLPTVKEIEAELVMHYNLLYFLGRCIMRSVE